MRRDNERCRVSPVGNMSTVALATRFRDSHLRPRLDFVAARHANSSACHGPFNPDQDSEFVVVVKFCTHISSLWTLLGGPLGVRDGDRRR